MLICEVYLQVGGYNPLQVYWLFMLHLSSILFPILHPAPIQFLKINCDQIGKVLNMGFFFYKN